MPMFTLMKTTENCTCGQQLIISPLQMAECSHVNQRATNDPWERVIITLSLSQVLGQIAGNSVP